MNDNLIVCDTPDKIHMFSLLSMKGRLKLEMKGLRFKPIQGQSTASVVKKMFGLKKGCRNEKALAMLEAEIERLQNVKEEKEEEPVEALPLRRVPLYKQFVGATVTEVSQVPSTVVGGVTLLFTLKKSTKEQGIVETRITVYTDNHDVQEGVDYHVYTETGGDDG